MMWISLADKKASIKVMERCGFIKLYEEVGKSNRNYDFVMTCMGVPATGKHITFEALENFKDSPSS